ncbi:molecular chaperone DnaJ [Actinoplanes sp. DH11]|uniref:molecular chaperone DnaJ n=1 Tax=Actinoplanes sp. DH11 TaxID=2857011 RepID=UPI001E37672E|nr:molecular chaperone DnaJ [Actinoplanes sp. DH11]
MSTLMGAERRRRHEECLGHASFEEAVARISVAGSFRELQQQGDAGSAYKKWAKIVHPDAAGAQRRATATEAFAKLSALYAAHEEAARGENARGANIPENARGDQHKSGTTLRTKTATYRVGPLFARGDIADIYADGAALLKIPRNPADNDLMDAEAAALTALKNNGDPKFRAYAPRLLDTFTHEDQAKRRRRVNVVERQRSMLRLDQAGQLTIEDAVWIWRRLLIAIGWAHRAGVVHGAVLESHILIHPERRGLVLLDWCYAGHRPRAIVKASEAAYPPEVLHDRTASPATDIYMATGLMTRVIGPSRLPEPLRRFAAGCCYDAPRMRPQDAWALLGEFDELIPESHRN